MRVHHFADAKAANRKLAMVTCYDYWSACLINETNIDAILVGDSAAMVMHGHRDTIPATVDMITYHTKAVARGATKKFIVADLPFCSYRKDIPTTVSAVEAFIRAGAHAVKLEGAVGNEKTVRHIVDSGIPVMGHIGLTLQTIHQLGGFRVQGKDQQAAEKLMEQAMLLQKAGCFALVLECVPAKVAEKITTQLSIPTIGIGAGANTSGQILVLQDLLGMNPNFNAKFIKTYMKGAECIKKALNDYCQDVESVTFPTEEHCY